MAEDYDALIRIIANAPAVLVTPNTLTETSNLAAYIAEPARSQVLTVLQRLVATSDETVIPSRTASARPEFLRLGLTDAALIEAASEEATLLTTDFNLFRAVLETGAPAINFNHIRDQYLAPEVR